MQYICLIIGVFILDQLTPSEYQEIASDLNSDGIINVVDIVLIVDLILQ